MSWQVPVLGYSSRSLSIIVSAYCLTMVGGHRLQHSLPDMLAVPLPTQELSEFYMLPGGFFSTAAVGNTFMEHLHWE